MKALNYLKLKNYELWLEKLVVGVEEPIFIKGVGNVLAKVDSGNGAYNVIHGEDFYYQGDVVVFTTFDENGRKHRVSKKVQDKIIINIGAGQTEERPVVLFDVTFATDEYLNIPFTVGNRSNNTNKVLLGQDFLRNKLDALIDISQNNISDKKIEVDVPLTEEDDGGHNFFPRFTAKGNPSGATSTLGKAAQATKGIIKGAYNMYKTLGTGNIFQLKKNWKDMMAEINDYQDDDKTIIFRYLNEKFMSAGQPIAPFVNDPQIYKILDYLGNTYMKTNPAMTETSFQNQSNSQNQEQDQQPNTSTSTDIINSSILELNIKNLIYEASDFQKIQKEVAKTNRPILYLVLFDGSKADEAKNILANLYPNFVGKDFKDMMNNIQRDFQSNSIKEFSSRVVSDLNKRGILSEFVLVSGKKGSRKVTTIAEVFKSSKLTQFLSEYVKDYADELTNYTDIRNELRSSNSTFASEPLFGLKVYNIKNRIGNVGYDESIRDWIEHWSTKKHNIKAAYNVFFSGGSRRKNKVNMPDDVDDTNNNYSSNNQPPPDSPSFSSTQSNTEENQTQSNTQTQQNRSQEQTKSQKSIENQSKKQRQASSVYPQKAPNNFRPPKKAKKLNNGHFIWKDNRTGKILEYDPVTNMIYDAIEWRRTRPSEENEENLLETTLSKFILESILD